LLVKLTENFGFPIFLSAGTFRVNLLQLSLLLPYPVAAYLFDSFPVFLSGSNRGCCFEVFPLLVTGLQFSLMLRFISFLPKILALNTCWQASVH
jgi:hypothetical protein